MAVDRMMTTYHKWSADKGTQLISRDLSVPKSARSGFGSKERRVYVRDVYGKGGLFTRKRTLHTAEGFEDLPHLVIKEGKEFAIYDAATGLRIRGQLPSKAVFQGTGADSKAMRLNVNAGSMRVMMSVIWIRTRLTITTTPMRSILRKPKQSAYLILQVHQAPLDSLYMTTLKRNSSLMVYLSVRSHLFTITAHQLPKISYSRPKQWRYPIPAGLYAQDGCGY